MNMKKRFLLSLLVITISIIVFGTISASAETEGIYTYTVLNGEAAIFTSTGGKPGFAGLNEIYSGIWTPK